MTRSFDPNELTTYLKENLSIELSTGYFGGYGLSLRVSLVLDGEIISKDTVSLSNINEQNP